MNNRKNMAKKIQQILTMVFDSMKSCNFSRDHFWFSIRTKVLFCRTSSICKMKISETGNTLFTNALLNFWKSGKTLFWLRRLFLQNCAPLTILRLEYWHISRSFKKAKREHWHLYNSLGKGGHYWTFKNEKKWQGQQRREN